MKLPHIYNMNKGRGLFMEYAKDEIFQVRYNTKLHTLEIGHDSLVKRTIKTMRRHKLITVIAITFLIFSTLNVVMICNFLKLLENL